MDTDDDKYKQIVQDYRILYDISEAEGVLLNQLAMVVTMLGLSIKLTGKLLKALAAIYEAIIDEQEKANK